MSVFGTAVSFRYGSELNATKMQDERGETYGEETCDETIEANNVDLLLTVLITILFSMGKYSCTFQNMTRVRIL